MQPAREAGFLLESAVTTAPSLNRIEHAAINPALRLLPAAMDSDYARVLLLTIGLQESQFLTRTQMGGGPARGFWQFEHGTPATRGGVTGVYLHQASASHLLDVCNARGVPFVVTDIYNALTWDDILAAALARLLMWTDPRALPKDAPGGWDFYMRTWRPGKPHPARWAGFFAQALAVVQPED
jgi:hypothetical protein